MPSSKRTYVADDVRHCRKVAIKVPKPELAAVDRLAIRDAGAGDASRDRSATRTNI